MDFLLKAERIGVEAKIAHSIVGREISDGSPLLTSRNTENTPIARHSYGVYDPAGVVKNPRGVERDLVRLSGDGLRGGIASLHRKLNSPKSVPG